MARPNIVIIAGSNGSGKTTAAPGLLRDYLGLIDFVNADVIAQGLSGFDADALAFGAGRIMLQRLRELAAVRTDFAFETTLASRTFAPWLSRLQQSADYRVHLIFLWLASPEAAIARVASRVQQGGHHVDDQIVRRRYVRGLQNLFRLYMPIVDDWMILDNSRSHGYQLVASGARRGSPRVVNRDTWQALKERYG